MDFFSNLINRPKSQILTADSMDNQGNVPSLPSDLMDINQFMPSSNKEVQNIEIQPNSKTGKRNQITSETAAQEDEKATIIVSNEEICVKSCNQLNGESCLKDQEIKTAGGLPDIVNVQPVIIATDIDDKEDTFTSVLKGFKELKIDSSKGEHNLSVPTLNVDGISSDDESFADCPTYTDQNSLAYNLSTANNSAAFVNNLISSIEGSIEDAIKHFDNSNALISNANQEFVIDSTTLSVDLENISMIDEEIDKKYENSENSLNTTKNFKNGSPESWTNPNSAAVLDCDKVQSISEFATPNTTINLNTTETLDEVSTTSSDDLQNILIQEAAGNKNVANSNNEAISFVSTVLSNANDSRKVSETCNIHTSTAIDIQIGNNENILPTNENENDLKTAAGTATDENQSNYEISSEINVDKNLKQDTTNNAVENINYGTQMPEKYGFIKNIENLTPSKCLNQNDHVKSINIAILQHPQQNIAIVNVVEGIAAIKSNPLNEGIRHIDNLSNNKIINRRDRNAVSEKIIKNNSDVITNSVASNLSSSDEILKGNIKEDSLNETIDITVSTNESSNDENILCTHDVLVDCVTQDMNMNSLEELNNTYTSSDTVNVNDCKNTGDFNETFISDTIITQFYKDGKEKDSSPLDSTVSLGISTEVPLIAEKISSEVQYPNDISIETVTPAENISLVPQCLKMPAQTVNLIESDPYATLDTDLLTETIATIENITSGPQSFEIKETAAPSQNISINQPHDISKIAIASAMDVTQIFDNTRLNSPTVIPEKINTTCPLSSDAMNKLSLKTGDGQIRRNEDIPNIVQNIFIENVLTNQMDVTFKTPCVNKDNLGAVSKRKSSDKDFTVIDEDFEGSGLILNPSDFDYLLTKGNNSEQINDRSSLLLRFDPLLGHAVPINNLENSLDQTSSNKRILTNRGRLSPAVEEEEANKSHSNILTGFEWNIPTPIDCKAIKQEEILKVDSEPELKQKIPSPTSQLIIPIEKNNLLPCIKRDDKMSVDVIQGIQIENDVKSADNVNSQPDEKQDYKMDDLEKKIKNEVLKTEDIEKKLKDAEQREEALLKRITEKDKTIAKMSGVIEAYEKAIAELIAEKEQIIQNCEKQMAEIKSDRDLNYQHLTSLESTFSDLHVKYERSKQLTAKLEASEESLRAEKKQNLENLRLQEVRYEKMKSHAMQQLEIANNKLESLTKEHTIEITRLRALLKKEEIARLSLNEQLQQKTRENGELMKICDELINGQGASS